MSGKPQKLSAQEIFEKVASELHHLCDHEQEIIEVNIEVVNKFFYRTHKMSVVRHWSDPEGV